MFASLASVEGLQWTGSPCFISGQRKDSGSFVSTNRLLLCIMLSVHTWPLHTWNYSELLLADFVGCSLAETSHAKVGWAFDKPPRSRLRFGKSQPLSSKQTFFAFFNASGSASGLMLFKPLRTL